MIGILDNKRFLVIMLAVLFILPLIYDIFEYLSGLSLPVLAYISEMCMILFLLLYYRWLVRMFNFQDKSINEILKLFVYLLGTLYLSVILSKIVLRPSFSPGTFPQIPETFTSVIYANVISLSAILFLTPILLLMKDLIYYKRKRRTVIFMRIFVLSTLACMAATVITGAELNLEFNDLGIYNNSVLIAVLISILILSFRNSWITYLSRREKISYFFISLFLIWAIFYLFEFAFVAAVPAHSLAIGVYANIVWYFLVTYTLISGFYLLLQLPTARVFDRKMREVASLHNLSRAISTEFNFSKLVKLITEMTTRVIGSDATWLELYRSGSDRLYIASSHNLTEAEIEAFTHGRRQDLSEQILTQKKPIIINELTKSHPYAYIRRWKPDINSIIGVPLISGNGKTLGILFATKKYSFGFDPDDQAMLEAYSNQAVIALDNAALLQESFERERLEEELRIAREVQQRLLPQTVPGRDGISIEAMTITAYEVGGDYYDFIGLPDDHLGFIIGDVSGKGTSAAFYMAEAKGIIQSLSKIYTRPQDLLVRTNEILYESLERKTFISMMMASMDCKNRTLAFARAGHCPLLYYNAGAGTVELLQPEGIGVGLEGGLIFKETLKEQQLDCNEGDIFVFYTDGLSEARNKAGEEFGDQRLCDIISANAALDVTELKQRIFDEITVFLDGEHLADDLTLILVKT